MAKRLTNEDVKLISGNERNQVFEQPDGQTTFLQPSAGTGMHDDPLNGLQRRITVGQMLKRRNGHLTGGDEIDLINTVNTSRVPLQHLRDLHHAGLRIQVGNAYGYAGMYDTPDKEFNTPPRVTMHWGEEHNTRIAVHELGHARHDLLSQQFYGQEIPGGASNEGIADGYADYYHGEPGNTGYSAEYFDERHDIMARAGESYARNRQAVASGGDVPHLPSGHRLPMSKSRVDNGEQLNLGL